MGGKKKKKEKESESESDSSSDSEAEESKKSESSSDSDSKSSDSDSSSDSDEDTKKKDKTNGKHDKKQNGKTNGKTNGSTTEITLTDYVNSATTAQTQPRPVESTLSVNQGMQLQPTPSGYSMIYPPGTMYQDTRYQQQQQQQQETEQKEKEKKLKMVGKKFLQKLKSGGNISESAKRELMLEGIKTNIQNDMIRFRKIDVTFLGSHHQFDEANKISSTDLLSLGRTRKSLAPFVDKVFRNPIILDSDIEDIVNAEYNKISYGLPMDILIHGYTNQSDKAVALVCITNDEFNTGQACENEAITLGAMYVAPPNSSKTFKEGKSLYNIFTHLDNTKHQKELVIGRSTPVDICQNQITRDPEGKFLVLIPPKMIGNMKHDEIAAQIIGKARVELRGEDFDYYVNNWLFAFIIHYGEANDYFTNLPTNKEKINPGKRQKIGRLKIKGKKTFWLITPEKVVNSALIHFSNQSALRKMKPTEFKDIVFQIFPSAMSHFCSSEGSEYGLGGNTTSVGSLKRTATTLEEQHNLKNRTISFQLEIKVLPVNKADQYIDSNPSAVVAKANPDITQESIEDAKNNIKYTESVLPSNIRPFEGKSYL